MKRPHWLFVACLLLASAGTMEAQTKLKLSTIIPGSENVQLVYNGDFQFQGPVSATNTHPFPTGWVRHADIFADPGTNMVPANSGVVARALVNGGASVCQYKHTNSLAPNTAYVLSAYVWNMGDSANHVTAVIDLNDATNEAQVTVSWTDANADQGYFVYGGFNTTTTGTNVVVRTFYDNPVGAFTASKYYPLGAQWDNVAITKSTDFVAPQLSGSGANLRPLASIYSPADRTSFVFTNATSLQIAATASDYDGTIAKVEFFADATRLGEATSSPYSLLWSNFGSGSYQLTAKATDNQGATTVSAPVAISVTAPPQAALHIARSGTNVSVYWPTSVTALSLQSASGLASPDWRTGTNSIVVSDGQYTVTVPNAGPSKFFQLGFAIDPSTLDRKLIMGYQGWFACPNDGSLVNRWVHWFRNNTPTAANATVDFWPDISELDADELFATDMTLTNGSAAKVYSAFKEKTVVRHFKWMKDNNLDGVFLQRFCSALSSPSYLALRNQVLANVRVGAETYGRVFAVMYDISGQDPASLINTLTNDWAALVNTLQVTNSPSYVRHHGKPVLAIWGFGFNDRPGTPEDALTVINYFKAAGLTVMGGVPSNWRLLGGDSQTNTAWAAVYRSFDIISPWAVGRYSTLAGANNFLTNKIMPDLTETTSLGLDYMPVIFPGFSWTNLNGGKFNQIPRNGGTFYWQQAYNAIWAGCTMLYGAMFDEMDEGTAMFKLAPTPNELPVQGAFVPLNVDGTDLPSDWYLRLADQAGRMLRGDIPLQPQMPITP